MSKHLFGLIVTPHGTAANNRGETEGNITTLQKILWNGEIHTTVSAEAIRWAIRWNWQNHKLSLNRHWKDDELRHDWNDPDFRDGGQTYLDDDVLGFMLARAAQEESNATEAPRRRGRARGTTEARRGRLEVTRAISLTPWPGDVTFNAASRGATPTASRTGLDPVPYGTEVHATRYQYAFALTPEQLKQKSRAVDVVEAIITLSQVAGNQGRFLYDFSPDGVIFRWTEDFAPRFLYGFALKGERPSIREEVLHRIKAGDINPHELVVGGTIAATPDGKLLKDLGATVFDGVKAAAEEIKKRIRADLGLK